MDLETKALNEWCDYGKQYARKEVDYPTFPCELVKWAFDLGYRAELFRDPRRLTAGHR